MVVHTRLDCVLGSAALMRRAVAEATHHAAHRAAFGRLLADQPLMQNVLADLCLESEAATVTAHAPRPRVRRGRRPFRRLATAVAKYWVCKATPPLVAEALECLGGNGYVEESGLPRLYRESPLNSIWEGSGNVNCLDVLRALDARARARSTRSLPTSSSRAGADPQLDAPSRPRGRARPTGRAELARGGSSSALALVPQALAARPPRDRRGRRRVLSPPGSAATAAARTGRCRAGSTVARSSTGTARGSDAPARPRLTGGGDP